jgi:hypothetical protein
MCEIEVKTEFIIKKEPWLDKYERFYLITKQGGTEVTLDWITSNIGEYTFETAKDILLKNLADSIIFETINYRKEID